jgi:predicted DNA-binding protein (MmcQ/YjbR family)
MNPASARVSDLCRACPGADVSQPFGPDVDVWKVGGKIFAAIGAEGVSLKTDSVETAVMLIDAGIAQRAPYFHKSWVRLPLDVDPQEAAYRVARSHALILATLPARLRAGIAVRAE